MKNFGIYVFSSYLMLSSAFADIVESEFAVGVCRFSMTNEFFQVALNFKDLDGNDNLTISNLFCPMDLYADPNGDPDLSDCVAVYDGGGGYTNFFYCDLDNPGDPQWYGDDLVSPASVSFSRGSVVWFIRSTNSTIRTLTVLGRVPDDLSYEHAQFLAGLSMFGSAYPKKALFNDMGIDSSVNPECYLSAEIHVYNGIYYDTFWYFDYLGAPQWQEYNGEYYEPTDDGLEIGQGAWYKHDPVSTDPVLWTEIKPY
ncbi:MAG: hypothetical protein R6X19_04820 [Kiritimatiellia bacterium]